MISYRLQDRRRGTTMVEFGVIVTLLVFLIAGTVVMGLGVFRYLQLAHLAREAARYAIVHGTGYAQDTGNAAATSQSIYDNAILPNAAGLDLSALSYTVTWDQANSADYASATSNPPGQPVANMVIVTVSYQWVPEGLFGGITLSSTSEMPMAY